MRGDQFEVDLGVEHGRRLSQRLDERRTRAEQIVARPAVVADMEPGGGAQARLVGAQRRKGLRLRALKLPQAGVTLGRR